MKSLTLKYNKVDYPIVRRGFLLNYIMFGLFSTIGYLLADEMGVWIGVGIFLFIIILRKLKNAVGEEVPLVYLMIFNYLNELFLFALVLYFIPPISLYDIGHYRYPIYLSYVIPCCLALYCGVSVALWNPKMRLRKQLSPDIVSPAWPHYAKHLFWLGILFTSLTKMLPSLNFSRIGFVLTLISSLRYVGFYVLVLQDEKKWWRYGLLLLFIEIIMALQIGFMHDLVLWGGCSTLIIAYQRKWKWKLVTALIIAYLMVFVLQVVKTDYREQIWGSDYSIADKAVIFANILTRTVSANDNLFSDEKIASASARFNQGWIVDRVMSFVPDMEPYALGSTLLEGLYGIVVPRMVDPSKPIAGGRKNFERFTGEQLSPYTAMTISTPGELYANFGPYGGIIGVGLFGYLIGLFYKSLYKRALANPAWWAWGPFCGFFAIKTSEGFMEIITWLVRSILIMVIVIFITKNIRSRKQKRV
jgi:hypothetical protein